MAFIKCPKCQAEIEGDSYFCDQCGAELFVCPKCGTFGKGKRCTRCGEQLVSAQSLNGAPAPSSANAPAAQAAPSAAPAQPQPTPAVAQPSPVMSQPTPSPSAVQSPSSPSGASITTDIDRVIGSLSPGAAAPAGATIRPGSVAPPAAQPAAPRQVPTRLVCRNPQLRLYIDDVIIGRREGGYASVFASFGMVSGRHAQISRTPSGGWQVMDLGSTNGTRVNGQQLVPNSPVAFWVGDVISFADIDFEAVLT